MTTDLKASNLKTLKFANLINYNYLKVKKKHNFQFTEKNTFSKLPGFVHKCDNLFSLGIISLRLVLHRESQSKIPMEKFYYL